MVGKHRCVDLGLSVNWADEDLGGFYSWGELSSESRGYYSNYYQFYTDITYSDMNDYVEKLRNSQDLKDKLGTSSISGGKYDVAKSKWGNDWRMPSANEAMELMEKCTWKWTTRGEFEGSKSSEKSFKVTGPSGKSIFMSLNGWYSGRNHNSALTGGFYWTGDFIGHTLVYDNSKGWSQLIFLKYGVQVLEFGESGPVRALYCAYDGLGVWPVTSSSGEPITNPEYTRQLNEINKQNSESSQSSSSSGGDELVGSYSAYVLKVSGDVEVTSTSSSTIDVYKMSSGSYQAKIHNSWCSVRSNSHSDFLGVSVSGYSYVATYVQSLSVSYYYFFDM